MNSIDWWWWNINAIPPPLFPHCLQSSVHTLRSCVLLWGVMTVIGSMHPFAVEVFVWCQSTLVAECLSQPKGCVVSHYMRLYVIWLLRCDCMWHDRMWLLWCEWWLWLHVRDAMIAGEVSACDMVAHALDSWNSLSWHQYWCLISQIDLHALHQSHSIDFGVIGPYSAIPSLDHVFSIHLLRAYLVMLSHHVRLSQVHPSMHPTFNHITCCGLTFMLQW